MIVAAGEGFQGVGQVWVAQDELDGDARPRAECVSVQQLLLLHQLDVLQIDSSRQRDAPPDALVERVSGLHNSSPEDGVQAVPELVLLLHGVDHVGPPLGLQRLFPGDRRGRVREEVLLPLGELVRLAADVPLGIVLVSLRDLLLWFQNGSIVVAEKSEPASANARGDDDMPTEATIQELGVDELLDYKPVPPRRVVRTYAQYRRQGRGQPLPYLLDEAGPE